MFESLTFLSAITLGLLGGAHCLGMCGGISASVGLQHGGQSARSLSMLLSYNFGRISSYTLAGALLGSLGFLVQQPIALLIMRSLAGLMLVLMGLYIARWWQGLVRIEQVGGLWWRFLRPLASRLLPAKTEVQALLLGGVWGWLPCGLVYSTLIWASAAADWQHSALLMLGFGLGTLPAMLLTGVLASQVQAILAHRLTQQVAGLMIIAFGLFTVPWQGWLSFTGL